MKTFFLHTIFAVLMLCCTTEVSAQRPGVEMQFASSDTIHLVAGDTICFQLVARDSLGAIITNWESVGHGFLLSVRNSIAATDTSMESWSRHPDGFSWASFIVEGIRATQISPDDYSIDHTQFVDGIANACFVTTKAERNIQLEVTPWITGLAQISPPMNVSPAAHDNYLVELTNPRWPDAENFYAFRPFEIVVSPRDRFLNKIATDIPARIAADIPAEIASIASMPPDPFGPNLVIRHTQNFFLRPTAERQTNPPQRIRVSHPTDPSIEGVSDPIFSIPHPPNPFGLGSPADQSALTLQSAQDRVYFTWQRPTPADPYTDIMLSRFDPSMYSDSVRYRIHFADAQMMKVISYDSCDVGPSLQFSMTQQKLDSVITELAGGPVSDFTLLWYVEATDGNYTTRSSSIGPNIPGHRILITNQLFTGGGIGLDTSRIISTTMRVGDEIRFDLHALANGNPIENWNDVGGCAALYLYGTNAEEDTSSRSWSSDPAAYSWSVLEVNGREIPQTHPRTYIIPPSVFMNGIASVRYRTSKSGPVVRFHALPLSEDLHQSTPPLAWEADTTENFLIEISWFDTKPAKAFLQRRFEIMVFPRDRYLNVTDEQVGVRFSAGFPGEFDTSNPGGQNLFTGVIYIKGATNYWLLPTALRQEPLPLQYLSVQSISDPSVFGQSDPFEVVPHAPTEFTLAAPGNHYVMNLTRHSNVQTFSWQRPNPPDPYTDIQVSRIDPRQYSDDVRYTWVLLDSASLTYTHRIESDSDGVNPILTLTEGQLYDIMLDIGSKAGSPVHNFAWYVEATDGLFMTISDPVPGHYFSMNADVISSAETSPHPSSVRLEQNYPNPFNPSTTIRFSTTKRGDVSLKVFDYLGREVAMVHKGMLDAGEHSVHFNATTLRSGVYVYRLDAEGISLSRRMIVLK